MEFHEAANIFPLDEENIGELAKDIRERGQQVPIELLNGKIIDGRRRFKACEKAGVKPKYKTVATDDPVAYVLSLNLHRRHLTASQRSIVGAKAREWYDEEAKKRQRASGGDRKSGRSVPVMLPEPIKGDARDIVGRAVGVSGSLIDSGTKVLTKGVPELAQAVEEGRLSVSSAAEIADEPVETQRKVASEAKVSGGRYRKPTIERKEDGTAKPGVGVRHANEAINSLIRIPKNDPTRLIGFQIVMDWIKRNK